jgi:hypothetical protein
MHILGILRMKFDVHLEHVDLCLLIVGTIRICRDKCRMKFNVY